jgi:hypothetical protein
LKAYADERQKLADVADIKSATQSAVHDVLAETRKEVKDVTLDVQDLIVNFQQAGQSADDIVALQRAFEALKDAAANDKATVEEVTAVHDALSALFRNSGIPDTNDLAGAFANLADKIGAAAKKANELRVQAAFKDLQEKGLPKLGTISPVFSGGGKFIDANDVQTARANNTLSQTQQAAEKADRSSRSSAATEAERQAQAVKDLISDLEFEQSLIGKTAVQRKEAIALRQAGAAATGDQKLKIVDLIDAIDGENAANKKLADTMRDINATARDALGTFIGDLENGKSAADALSDALKRVGDRLIDMALSDLFPTKGGGILSSLFGSFFGGGGGTLGEASGFGSSYASGTTFAKGGLSLVGEQGPELINLPRGSEVIPHHRVAGMLAPGGGTSITYAPTIDARGADSAAVARIQETLARDKTEFSARVVKAVQKANKSHVDLGMGRHG